MNRFHKIAVIVAALIFVANGQLIASNFTSEVVVNLDNTPLHVKHFEVYPSNTIINSSQSKAEEQSPEKEMRMWYWPRSIEELCDLYPVGSKPYVKDQEDFLAGKTKRNPNEDYIVLVDKVRFHFDSCEYEFVKFLRFKGGRLAGSGVGCFTIGEARRYTMTTSMPALFMKFNSFFWETEARGFAYLLYGDESLLNLQANGKKNITDRLFEIRKSCLTESGEFSPVKFFERAKSIRRYGDPIEQTALEHLMVQPVIMPEKGIVLTGAQKDRIRSDLRELNEKQTDKVIISIEQGVVDNARNELEQRKGIWSEDVNKLIGKWIGEESVKRPPQKNIVMTGVQKDRIRSDLREMSEKNMNSVISLIEKGAMINALIEVRECNGVSSDEAQELIEKWIGRQCFARPPQSKQGDK